MNSTNGRCHDDAQCTLWKYVGKNERRAVLQPWRQAGELHYERVEDYDLEILYELLGQQKNLHRQRWAASGRPKKALLWSYLSRCIILVRIKCVKWYWQNHIGIGCQTCWAYQSNTCCNGNYFLNHFENLLSCLVLGTILLYIIALVFSSRNAYKVLWKNPDNFYKMNWQKASKIV